MMFFVTPNQNEVHIICTWLLPAFVVNILSILADSCDTAAHIRQGVCIDTEPIVITILTMECYRILGISTKAQKNQQSTNRGNFCWYVLCSITNWVRFTNGFPIAIRIQWKFKKSTENEL